MTRTPNSPFFAARGAWEREFVRAALERHHGNISATARTLGVTRRYLHILIDKYGVREPQVAHAS